MEECLITDKVCSNTNKKCKECKLDECKEVLNMVEAQQSYEDRYKMEQLRKQLPKECKYCCFLETRDDGVYCFYRYNGKCVLKKIKGGIFNES